MKNDNKEDDEVEGENAANTEIKSEAVLTVDTELEHNADNANDGAAEPDSWESYQARIDSLIANERCNKSIRRLDERLQNVAHRTRRVYRDAPKSFAERAINQLGKIDQQLEMSSTRLGQLVHFGNHLVTNIRVANERRELDRRMFESSQQREIKRRLDGENMESMAKFEDIKDRWTELDEINEPMLLWDQIEDQKKRIAEIMERKDEMINACQTEIDRMNAKYEFDRQRQAADLCCLVERIDNQVETLKEAYKHHLELLRNTVEDERQTFSLTAEEKWRSFFNALKTNFDEKSNLVRVREEFYAQQTQQLQEYQDELTKQTRVRLEKECGRLELELRRTRDNVLMNSEKLDYNYQVLQRRNEENTIINNQQKRRVARLYETVARTRRNFKEVLHSGQRNIAKLTQEIQALHNSITDMESKALHTRQINRNKFNRVWNINYEEITLLLQRIFNIDRILHEQQLVMPWQKPNINIENINKPAEKRHVSNAMDRIERRFGRLPKQYGGSGCSERPSVEKQRGPLKELPPESARLMRNILRKMADRGGFLIEERLLRILKPYTEMEQTLVRIDNIFSALRIHNFDNVLELTKVFEPYTYCPNCQPEGLSSAKCAEVFLKEEHDKAPKQTHDAKADQTALQVPADKISWLVKGYDERATACPNHYLVMEPALVLHAMNLYTNRKHKEIYGVNPEGSFEGEMIQFEDEEIEKFWRQFANIFPDSKTHLWKTLEHGLNHYVEVLKMRVQYDAEVVFLRRQNRELRHLLQKFKV
ncbi:dynein regulatory complex protein 1 homolog [Drosophila grimshawi]|uniref:GH24094 n=1 Tax=Drosophila grimshawi TaxID=7222 RepID=B4JNQ9_DROGR|nr:dynein regulatory complex protein 1 homolog [Drosophila grimshawi]EDV92352.1 GH24094 [Drosophila grimshawi]